MARKGKITDAYVKRTPTGKRWVYVQRQPASFADYRVTIASAPGNRRPYDRVVTGHTEVREYVTELRRRGYLTR